MQLDLIPAFGSGGELSPRMDEAVRLIAADVWRDAATAFYIECEAKRLANKPLPKGIQAHLNKILDERFEESGWEVYQGRYRIEDVLVRVTFRHQMSLGSDFIDAQVAARRADVRQIAICAAPLDFLKVITPNDAAALVSYEKLRAQADILDGVIDLPLYLGRLTPRSALPDQVARAIHKSRPRDTYSPASDPTT